MASDKEMYSQQHRNKQQDNFREHSATLQQREYDHTANQLNSCTLQGHTQELTEGVLYRRDAAGADPGIWVRGTAPLPSSSPPFPSLIFTSP